MTNKEREATVAEIEEPIEILDDQDAEVARIVADSNDPIDIDALSEDQNSPDAAEGADESGAPVVSEWGSEEGLGT
jgi:hypothetical protein